MGTCVWKGFSDNDFEGFGAEMALRGGEAFLEGGLCPEDFSGDFDLEDIDGMWVL